MCRLSQNSDYWGIPGSSHPCSVWNISNLSVQFSRSAQSCLTLCDSVNRSTPRPPCLSPTPGVDSNSCPSSRWCHPAISSSGVPFSSCPQSLPASGSFPMSQLFTWGGQSIGVSASASVLPMNTQGWYPLGWTGWISLQSKGLSGVFPSTTTFRENLIFHTGLNEKYEYRLGIYHQSWRDSVGFLDTKWMIFLLLYTFMSLSLYFW